MDDGYIVSSARVGLRRFTLDDVDDVTAACQDPEIIRWTAKIPSPYTAEHARWFIEHHDEWRRDGVSHNFAIVDIEAMRFSGSISLELSRDSSIQVGYWVAPWARRRGLATEALRLITAWGFDTLGCVEIELLTKVGNIASEQVAQKNGYVLRDEFAECRGLNDTVAARRWVRTTSG